MPAQCDTTILPAFTIHPLTSERWPDLEALFGVRGACGGCWCMWWRLRQKEWDLQKGEANKEAFRGIITSGPPPGLLAYADGEPAAWCQITPRSGVPRLTRAPQMPPANDLELWAISCFFVAKTYRRRGLSVKLIEAAVAFAKQHGADAVDGYPLEPKKGASPDAFAWTGLAAAFRAAGFEEISRRSPTRPNMRYHLHRH